jgi:hypothetical protein
MVEVFKTNVRSIHKANLIIQKLAEEFPAHKINFDLNDCERILRVQTFWQLYRNDRRKKIYNPWLLAIGLYLSYPATKIVAFTP